MARRVNANDGRRRVLLTGATGLIGPKVLERLVAQGDDVRVLALPDTVDDVADRDAVTIVPGSLEDADALEAATTDVDVVHHLAGMLPGADPAEMFRVNVDGTERLLDACVEQGVRRFVFVSSVSVYRPAPFPFMWPLREDSPQAAHGNDDLRNYGQSKIDAEAAILQRGEQGLEWVILRPPTSYGRGAPFVTELLEQVLAQPMRTARRAGRMGAMQWIHTDDLADAVVLAGTRRDVANEVFNVAGGELITVARLAALLGQVTGGAQDRIDGEPLPGGLAFGTTLRFDIGKAQRVLGFEPQVSLEQGLAEMIDDLGARDGGVLRGGTPGPFRRDWTRRRSWHGDEPGIAAGRYRGTSPRRASWGMW